MNKRSQMFALIEAYQESPLDRMSFCAEHGISLSKLNYWLRKWRKNQPETSDTKVSSPEKEANFALFSPVAPSTLGGCELIYPNGVRLQLLEIDLARFTDKSRFQAILKDWTFALLTLLITDANR